MKTGNCLLAFCFALTLIVSTSAQSKVSSFQAGIESFQAADYSGALEQLREVAQQSPSNVPVQLWLGLAYTALDNEDKAQDIWRAGIGDPKWESVTWALKGLAFWKLGQKTDAAYYFKQAEKSKPNYEICQRLLAGVNNDEDMPPISDWAQASGLQKIERTAASSSTKTTLPINSPPPIDKTSKTSGTRPSGGLWRGTVTNQKGNQTVSFRVSGDGQTISDITFVGYWRCSGRTESTRNAPPEDVRISGGSFSSTQNDKPSRLWYQFIGEFSSNSTATGRLRMAFAGTECDTYRLQWTASR